MRTAKRIRRFIDDHLLDERVALRDDPLENGLLDSLAIEQLITFMEDEFDLEFDDEELIAENFASVATVAALVDAKRDGR